MISRKRLTVALSIFMALLLVGGTALVVRATFFKPTTIRAVFATVTGIYPGDDVRIAGISVGRIDSIHATGTHAEVTMSLDRGVPVSADAKAVIVAQNLVAARYVQLTPAYESGQQLSDGSVIPVERTAVPVEWDEVKRQLMRLATDLAPTEGTSSAARFIESAADALEGNGPKLRQTLAQLSGLGRILAEGSGDIVGMITNLQTFVTALRDSKIQIVQFEDRLATLTSVLDENKSDLDAALTNLSQVVGDLQSFIANTRDKTSEQVQRLANVTQNLVDNRQHLEQVLHVAPNSLANAYNMYNPDTGTEGGSFVFNNFANPVAFICAALGGIENVTAPEAAKRCAQYLGPALRLMNLNTLPIAQAPVLGKSASPENLVYAEPRLAPGGEGSKPGPAETPPAVSAYTGLYGDVPPPAGFGQPPGPPGAFAPDGLPAYPSPAVFRGAPPVYVPDPRPAPPTLQDMLLPAEAPPASPPAPPPGAPPPGEGTPP